MNKKAHNTKKRWSLKGMAIFGIIIYLLFSFAHLSYRLHQTNLQVKVYEDKKKALLAERERFQELIKQLNDDNYIERMAREELGLVKPGETVIIPAVPGQARSYIPPKPGDKFAD